MFGVILTYCCEFCICRDSFGLVASVGFGMVGSVVQLMPMACTDPTADDGRATQLNLPPQFKLLRSQQVFSMVPTAHLAGLTLCTSVAKTSVRIEADPPTWPGGERGGNSEFGVTEPLAV